MAQSTYGNETLPVNGNVSKGNDEDTQAMVTALQNLAQRIQYGAGAPSAAVSAPSIYIRTNGTSVSSIYLNPTGNTWTSIALRAEPNVGG